MNPKNEFPPIREANEHFEQHGTIRCVVVLEDRDAVRERIEELLKDAYWVPIPEKDWRQCEVWAQRLVRYFILDIVLFDDRSAGFKALERIKETAPDSYCAVVTEDVARVHGVAHNLRADHICGKSDEDLRDLLHRLASVSPVLSERERALLALNEIRERAGLVGLLLEDEAVVEAERELVTLEPPLARMFSLTALGDEFATIIDALRWALVNQPGRELSPLQWQTWLAVLERTFKSLPMSGATALELTSELDHAGWITEPPRFELLADLLLGDKPEDG